MATIIDSTLVGALRHPEKRERAETPLLRKPEWLRVRAPGSPGYQATRAIVRAGGLTTALYESTGDAPDLDPPEERQMASAAQDVAQDEAAGDGAPALFDQTLAAAAKLASAPAARTASPGAKPTPPRSYLPIIAAQRLIQSRRF